MTVQEIHKAKIGIVVLLAASFGLPILFHGVCLLLPVVLVSAWTLWRKIAYEESRMEAAACASVPKIPNARDTFGKAEPTGRTVRFVIDLGNMFLPERLLRKPRHDMNAHNDKHLGFAGRLARHLSAFVQWLKACAAKAFAAPQGPP